MSLSEIIKIYEQRRRDLIGLLEHGKTMDLGKQHQIYGAILEIETFLKTLQHFKLKEQEEQHDHKFNLQK